MNPDNTSGGHLKSGPIMGRFKSETAERHAEIEALPYFEALMAHSLPLIGYVAQLKSLAVIHSVLENEIASSRDPVVRNAWSEDLRKLSLLETDIRFFEPRTGSSHMHIVEIALNMAEKIRLRSVEAPITLLGYLYVFEGSTLGNHMHRTDVISTFKLDSIDGSRYYNSYQDDVASHWQIFSERMNTALKDSSEHDTIIDAAHEAFDGLATLYEALHPISPREQHPHITQINPEAGNHPMPEDEREIEAALRASTRAWEKYAYFALRYGERGKRFSDSDACWIATLTQLDTEGLIKQTRWLGRYLVSHGMPQIMLEHTLHVLHDELVSAVPDNKRSYDKLKTAADDLKKTRSAIISEMDVAQIASEFDQLVGTKLAQEYTGSGELLVASVADDLSTFEGIAADLENWMTDGQRFPEEWIASVNATIKRSRRMAGGQSESS